MHLTYLLEGKEYKIDKPNELISFVQSEEDNRFYLAIKPKKDIVLKQATIVVPFKINTTDRYFLNGYQSWTDTHLSRVGYVENSFKRHSHLLRKVFPLDKYGDVIFYKYRMDRLHSFDVFYSQGENEIYLYNNNYKTAYLIIELQKTKNRLILFSDVEKRVIKANETFVIYDYFLSYKYEEGKESFKKKFPKRNIPKLFGYTSWYNYYQNINEEIILRDLSALDDRFDLFQIDDGYETFVGDWLDIDPIKFPNGLKPIIDKIHAKNLKAGIWLAPFVAEEKSKLFQEHKEYFRLDESGNPIKVGVNWSGQYVLDIENEEVIKYIKKCLQYYIDLGFDFFKLDFLYAVNVPNDYTLTRSEISQKAYELLKDILKDKIILGCGATLFNSIGNFDYLRVGPDMTLTFDDVLYMRMMHRERPSTKVTIQNTIYRSFMDQRLFGNDPDVFLLRDENTKLTIEQRKALVYMDALFGSLLLTSDDIATYKDIQKDILSYALRLYYEAEDVNYKVYRKNVHVNYLLDGVRHSFIYHINKGILTDEKEEK